MRRAFIGWSLLAVAGCGDGIGDEAIPDDAIAFAFPDDGVGLVSRDGTEPRTLTNSGSSPVWSADGESLSYLDAGLAVVELEHVDARELVDLDTPIVIPQAWDPAGGRIAVTAGTPGQMWMVDVETSDTLALVGPDPDPGAPSWTADGRKIVTAVEGGILEVDAEDGLWTMLTSDPVWGYATASPATDRIAFVSASDPCTVELISVDGTDRTQVGIDPGRQCQPGFAWAHDGSRLAWATLDQNDLVLWVAELPDGAPRVVDEQPPGRVWGMDFSPDGELLVYAHDYDLDPVQELDVVLELVDVENATSRHLADGASPRWRPRP